MSSTPEYRAYMLELMRKVQAEESDGVPTNRRGFVRTWASREMWVVYTSPLPPLSWSVAVPIEPMAISHVPGPMYRGRNVRLADR